VEFKRTLIPNKEDVFMRQKNYVVTSVVIAFVMIFFLAPGSSFGQNESENIIPLDEGIGEEAITLEKDSSPEDQGDKKKAEIMSLFQLIRKGGIVGYLIILLSIVALGLVIDYSITIRRSKIVPPKDIAVLRKLIQDHKFQELNTLDQEKASFLSQVVIAGLKDVDTGYQAVIKAMEDASEALSARIARKIEHLNVIGNISPMMGLLGTVIGMLRCFNEISQVTGAIEPKQLAGGIFEALVTTCMGLIVAIPALYFFAIFRNRVDEFTGEAALTAEELVAPLKPGNQRT
jgi:biopolymer transport protein ExbB